MNKSENKQENNMSTFMQKEKGLLAYPVKRK